MAHLLFLGFEVAGVVGGRGDDDGHALGDFDAVAAQAGDLAGVVGQQIGRAHV